MSRFANSLSFFLLHWALLLPNAWQSAVRNLRMNGGAYAKKISIYMLVFGVPIAIGTACGYAAWINHQRIALEHAIDTIGVPVKVHIDHAHVWRFGESPLSPETANRSYGVCYLNVSYIPPGASDAIRKELTPLRDPNSMIDNYVGKEQPHCGIYKSRTVVAGKVLPDNPQVMILDTARRMPKDRSTFLFWLSVVFTGIPGLLLAIGFLQFAFSGRNGRTAR